MEGPQQSWLTNLVQKGLGQEEEKLPRALVAGLMLEVLLEPSQLPENLQARRDQVKARLKTSLVAYLAGHVPLEAFRTLTRNLETWFDLFYPLVSSSQPGAAEWQVIEEQPVTYVCRRPPQDHPVLIKELLEEHLNGLQDLLPRRRHRKLDRDRLVDFFGKTGGDWFRLSDLESYFGIDRKTAWEYAQKLIQAGLLVHNQGRSASVRYRLSHQFFLHSRES
jgi:hypothetical protein